MKEDWEVEGLVWVARRHVTLTEQMETAPGTSENTSVALEVQDTTAEHEDGIERSRKVEGLPGDLLHAPASRKQEQEP